MVETYSFRNANTSRTPIPSGTIRAHAPTRNASRLYDGNGFTRLRDGSYIDEETGERYAPDGRRENKKQRMGIGERIASWAYRKITKPICLD
ncbi:MAG: hypothetical protein WCP89_02905 [archaeon]